MNDAFDLVVVGAGPGGMAAAAIAAKLGRRVCLVDDNAACGGQIWRGKMGEAPRNGPAAKWLSRFQGRVDVRSGWRAAAPVSAGILRLEREGEIIDVHSPALILATGARELFLPFPGWTLPGVYGAGGLQAFVKSGLDINGKRVVVAGTGPLLVAVAAGLRKAGACIVAVIEQAPKSRLARFSLNLLPAHGKKLLEGAGYGSRLLGTPYLTGAWVQEACGDKRLQRVKVMTDGSVREFDTDMLAVGYHLVPNVELAQMLDCQLEGCFVSVDSLQHASVNGIYCVGEITGIGGVDKAQIEGQIAAFAASGQPGRAGTLIKAREREKRFAQRLETAFALREELRALAEAETIVCRCEDVTHGELRTCHSWREAKLHTRCGMGPCQGRICGPATRFLYGWESPPPRPPLFPAPVATLAMALAGDGARKT